MLYCFKKIIITLHILLELESDKNYSTKVIVFKLSSYSLSRFRLLHICNYTCSELVCTFSMNYIKQIYFWRYTEV